MVLTEGELFAAALFDRLLEQYDNTPIAEDLRRIFGKTARSLPERVTVDIALFGSQVSFVSEHQSRIDAEAFERIFTALKTAQDHPL
ncbi:MAG: hypothetical protein LBD18_06685 [Treponema sp.]|nr:hypothetical protein [Treponema sp.]